MDTNYDEGSTYAQDVFGQLRKENDEFFNKQIHIAGSRHQETARYLDTNNRKYVYNQWETINLIDLYYNSKFESGQYDTEKQRKIFLNIVKFRADVASKQIDLNVKDFKFIPEEGESVWPAYFMGKEFSYWAKENYFGELLDRCVRAFPRYGWVVLKEVNGSLEFVPIQTIRCQQDARSIDEATYFTIEHPRMTLEEMKKMKRWDTSGVGLKPGQVDNVYERYGLVRLSEYKNYKKIPIEKGDENELIDCLTILTLRESTRKDKNGAEEKYDTGHILFMEKISKRPFIDVKWETQYGRLMGIGEVENLFENQIATNMAFNLYRRQLLWTSKKIFQSPSEEVARNLVKDVKDGDVLTISPNGNVTQVDMTDRASADFRSFTDVVEKNSDQKAFTFESATGESMDSGTPFRLGVMLSNAVNSHFKMKRDLLGLFFKRVMKDYIIPKWKQEFDQEHILSMFSDEEGFGTLKEIAIDLNLHDHIKQNLLKGEVTDIQAARQQIADHLDKQQYLFVKIPDSYYDDVMYRVNLTITGEDVDINKKIETLTNLHAQLVQTQDPRSEKIVPKLLQLGGMSPDMLGPRPQQPDMQEAMSMQGSAPKPTILPNLSATKAPSTL